MSNINKKHKFDGEVRNKDEIYVGKDKHGESWFELDINKMTATPCEDWEHKYPKQMAKARKSIIIAL